MHFHFHTQTYTQFTNIDQAVWLYGWLKIVQFIVGRNCINSINSINLAQIQIDDRAFACQSKCENGKFEWNEMAFAVATKFGQMQ